MSGNDQSRLKRSSMKLPNRKAFEISLKSIKIRFWRSVITAAGIFLGIAFFASVRMSAVFTDIQQDIIASKIRISQSGGKLSQEDMRLIEAAANDKSDREAAGNRLNWLSIMALIVCAVGITNAMLMSVTERYKEIGTMKCLGALNSFIVKLFFIESCLLGIIASFCGFLLGWLAISIVHLFSDGFAAFGHKFLMGSLVLCGMSVGIGLFLTALATIFPANNAAKMPAAAALRVEI